VNRFALGLGCAAPALAAALASVAALCSAAEAPPTEAQPPAQAQPPAAWWLAKPDQTEPKILEWAARFAGTVSLVTAKTRGGHTAYAVTVTDPSLPDAGKKRLVFSQPHAHEPAATAGMMDFLAQLLEGRRLDGRDTDLARRRILAAAVLTFIPDGNPDGRSRSPEAWWDGRRHANEQFLEVAFGRGQDGKRFPRQGRWSSKEQQPERLGIVYEQISDHEYVEPNRDPDSTFFRLVRGALEKGPCGLHVDLHQTEFEKSDRNAMVVLPFMQKELPEKIQDANRLAAEAIGRAWQAAGARPTPEARPLGYGEDQIRYFRKCWGDIYRTVPHVTVEIQNNSLATPPAEQMRLMDLAIRASIDFALRD